MSSRNIGIIEKDPGETVLRGIDWSCELGGASIVSSVWEVTSGAGLTLADDSNTTDGTEVFISAGTLGEQYRVQNTITTSSDEILIATLLVRVVDR